MTGSRIEPGFKTLKAHTLKRNAGSVVRMKRSVVAALALAPAISLFPATVPASAVPSATAAVTSAVTAKNPAKATVVAFKKRHRRGSLRVVAKGVPQGRAAKITVAGKKYRKKLPKGGKLRRLRPGVYRVWAAPIVSGGGTSAVPNLPVRVKVRKSKRAKLRLQYLWNPKTDSYPPGPASGLEVTARSTGSVSLRWVNGQAPDLQMVAVRRKTGSAPPTSLEDGRVVSVDRLATSAVDTGLKPHTTYSYGVFMLDRAGNASVPAVLTTRTLGRATAVTTGTAHTCALLDNSDADTSSDLVECWGANTSGQLGHGSTDDADTPQVVDLPDVVQVAAGGDHTCARQSDGDLWCWGSNDYGQLGRGNTKASSVPVRTNITDVVTVAAGGDHTCAVLDDATVRCWGRNDHGQLGVAASASEPNPVRVPGISNAVSVATGYAHSCAVLSDKSAWCWGLNDHGQLGDGSQADSTTPVRSVISSVDSVTAGVFHTCALQVDHQVRCWGGNDYGQLGDASTHDRLVPTRISVPSARALSAGAYHTCAALDGGGMRCWGRNQSGRLGDGSQIDRLSPASVLLSGTVTSVAAGGYHSCAVTALGTMCWGSNNRSQLGTGSRVGSLRPVLVSGL